MATPRVFVSYSHENRQALERLQTFLKPLERDGLIDCWDDTRLQAGEDWQSAIDAALSTATAVVLFISPDFLSSDFIYHEELPRILARAHSGALTVVPVFLSPSNVAEVEFPFHDQQGQEHRHKLTRFQGFGTPTKPLSDLTWSDRERVYQQLSQRIRQLAMQRAPDEPRPRLSHRPEVKSAWMTTTPTPEPAYADQLTIHLEQSGDLLNIRYYLRLAL